MSWPEPVIRVQSLSESGLRSIPKRYVKPLSDRPSLSVGEVNIPVIDLEDVTSKDLGVKEAALGRMEEACRDWGFFQVVNHGVNHTLMKQMREAWRDFFHLPMELKQTYANSPCTYEGYGSRLGIEKGAILDWSDYYFLNYLPDSLRNTTNWPSHPPLCR